MHPTKAFGRMDHSRLMFLLAVAAVSVLCGDDWPQILGPARSGVSRETLPGNFPAGGPKKLWETPVGQGYAGPAVVGDVVVLFHRVANQERAQAFDAQTGRPQWTTNLPARYRGGVDSDTGPRCVPLIDGGRVFLFGAAGDCHCLKLTDGEVVWSRSLGRDYDAPDGYFGAGSTPIILKDRLLINLGAKGAGLIALEADSGKTAWAVGNEAASYSSPTVMKIGGAAHAIFITRLNVVEVDPADGKATVRFKFGKTGPTVNAAMPLVVGSQVFATASYGVGAVLADLRDERTTTIWSNDTSLSSQYSTPVLHEGYLYGIHGREDIPPSHLRCVEWKTGKVRWSDDGFGVAHPLLAGNRLLLLKVDGELVLAETSPEKYIELGRATLARSTTRALPAFSNGRLLVRSTEKLMCFELRSEKE